MTCLNLTVAACDQSILFTGEHPERGAFLALIEHADGWPTYATVLLDGEPVPLEALGDEVVERISEIAARIIARSIPPQGEERHVAPWSGADIPVH